MQLEIDHLFILTTQPKEAGDRLVRLGLKESFSRDHKGQGTSNRRFEFSNRMLELLYIRDEDESRTGPASGLHLPDRTQSSTASPFGLVMTKLNDNEDGVPFDGWAYQPDYFPEPNAFHVGDNSDQFNEPLCIYVPFMTPKTRGTAVGGFTRLSKIEIGVPSQRWSSPLIETNKAERLTIFESDSHLTILTLDEGQHGLSNDFRPILPMIINW